MSKFLILALALALISLPAFGSEHPTCGNLASISSHDTVIEQQPSLHAVLQTFTDLKPRKSVITEAIVYFDQSGAVFSAELSPPTRFTTLNKEITRWALSFKFKPGQCGKAVIPLNLSANSR